MATEPLTWKDEQIQIGDTTLHLRQGGSGDALLVLHDGMGRTEPLRYTDDLAQIFSL